MSDMIHTGVWTGRRRWIIGACVVVAAAVALAVAVRGDGGTKQPGAASTRVSSTASSTGSPGVSSTASSTASPGATTTTASPGPAATGAAQPTPATHGAATAPVLPPVGSEPVRQVALGGQGDLGGGVVVRIVALSKIKAVAKGVGEISGDAFLVTFEVTNSGAKAVPLDPFTVTAYSGSAAAPASPIDSDSHNAPFAGSVKPSGSARGAYVFAAPSGGADLFSFVVMDGSVPVAFQGDTSTWRG